MTERVLGPTGSRRRRRMLVLPASLVLAVGVVFGVTSAIGASLPNSKFEIDGTLQSPNANLVVDTAGNLDWANITQLKRRDLETGSNDDSYQGGVKEDTACPGTTTGSIPNNKSDLLNFGSYFEPEAGGPGWLHVYWQRVQEPSGTTNMDFEFNKSTTDCDGAGESKNVTRTVGDILLQFDIDQGGAVAKLSKRTWQGSAWSDPPVALSAIDAIGAVNQAAISAANADELGAMSVRTFGEASFDLSQVFDGTKCESFGSAMLKSRSSDSFTSQLKDFIAPIPVNITNCGKVIIRKVTDPAGNAQQFGYTKAFGTDPSSGNTFNLTGEAGANSLKTFEGVLFGNGLTVTEDSPLPSGWVFVSLDCSASSASVPAADRIVSGRTVTFKIDNAADILDCTYTNRLNQGAILVTKTRKHAAAGSGDHPQEGVEFTVNGVKKNTDANGKACFDGLQFAAGGTAYNVVETLPAGYSADEADLTKSVTVDNAAKCSDNPYVGEAVTFRNTPLTDVTITINSQVDGGTASSVACTNGGPNFSTGANGDGTGTASNLPPKMGAGNTIVCTIEIDP